MKFILALLYQIQRSIHRLCCIASPFTVYVLSQNLYEIIVLVFSSSRLLVFSSSRLLVFSSSRLLVFSSSRLLVFSSALLLLSETASTEPVFPSPPVWDASEDTDQDGLRDVDELLLFDMDPLDPDDGLVDVDGDGLSTAEEIFYETDLFLADTDGDSWNDGDELMLHTTDPLDPKSFPQGDGVQNPNPTENTNSSATSVPSPTASLEQDTPPASLLDGDFNELKVTGFKRHNRGDYQGNAFDWGTGVSNMNGWEAYQGDKIEVWKSLTGEQFIELDGWTDHYGVKQTIKYVAPGSYVLTWQHCGRSNPNAGENAYSVKVYYLIGETKKEIANSGVISGISKTAWETAALGFTITAEQIAAAGGSPFYVAFIPENLNTYGTLIDKVSLVNMEVVPDWNRDGMINNEDSGKANGENPFIFWINDDDDANPEHEFADIPQSGQDGLDMVVNGERDLVDFFPVQLRIQKLLEVFPPDKYSYKISHPTGALHFIEMPTVQPDSQRVNGAGSYLADEEKAAEAMSRPMKGTANGGSELSQEYLGAVKNGLGVLLFESGSATNQPFELVLFKKSNNSKMARIPSENWMNLVPVHHMFWKVNIRGAIEPNYIPPAIEEAQNERFRETRKNRWFVFCHGYNVDEKRARGWNAEIFKRLHHEGSDAKFLGVTWEGNQGQIGGVLKLFVTVTPDYWHNAYNAFRSSSALAALVNGLNGGEKVIAGHSLGNMLVSSAICDHGLNAEQYFMLNAAVAREAYFASHADNDRFLVGHPDWAKVDTRLWSTDYWNLGFAADDGRRKLTWRGRFSTLGEKTNPHNYYSTEEDVLESGKGKKPDLLMDVTIRSRLAWVKQEMGKGEFTKKLVTGVHQSNGGWATNNFWKGNPPADAQELKANPYFKPFTEFPVKNEQNPESIHGPNGSSLAKKYIVRSFLLGHDLPALSNPAGSNEVRDFSLNPRDTNTDMPDEFKSNNWGNWQHNDLKKQSMNHVRMLFADMVSRGDLNDRTILNLIK